MKSFLSIFLSLMLLLSSLPLKAAPMASLRTFEIEKDCPEGSCVEELIAVVQEKERLALEEGCLPPQGTQDAGQWFQKNIHSLHCYQLVNEIEELHDKIAKLHAHLSLQTLGQEGQCCGEGEWAGPGLNVKNLHAIDLASSPMMCTEAKKSMVRKNCAGDMACVIMSHSISLRILDKLSKNTIIPKNCDQNKDHCLVQFVTSFARSLNKFREGISTLFKKLGEKIGLFEAAKVVEDSSSTAQLGAINASKDDTVFRSMLKDFGQTMSNIWNGFMESIKYWLGHNVFCQQWEGVPQFSQCLRPATGLDCLECRTMATGLCASLGAIVSELVPIFLTGGLSVCAKYGVSAASRVARLFTVSDATIQAIKSSKIVTLASKNASMIKSAYKSSTLGNASIKAMKTSLSAINSFLLRPSVKVVKTSLSALKLIKNSVTSYVMLSAAGPVVLFGKAALSVSGKVLFFPLENPATIKAFQLGEKSFEKIFTKVGNAKLFNALRPVLAAEATKAMHVIDDAYIKMQILRHTRPSSSKLVMGAEENYLKTVSMNRQKILDPYLELRPNVKLSEVLDEFYPELIYGKFARHLNGEQIILAEKELLQTIGRISNPKNQERLLAAFQNHSSSTARAEAVAGRWNFTRKNFMSNAALADDVKLQKGLLATGLDIEKLKPEVLSRLEHGMRSALNVSGEVWSSSYQGIARRYVILKESGFTSMQAQILVRGGYVYRAPAVVPPISP